MAIIHDAYLFNPANYAAVTAPFVESLRTSPEGYKQLCSSVLQMYQDSPQMQALAAEYGGWDLDAMVDQMPLDYPREPEDIAFWFVLLLYNHVKTEPHGLGLGNSWRIMDGLLHRLYWEERKRSLLIKGRRFEHFPEKRLYTGETSSNPFGHDLRYWSHLHPFSTSASAGWLDYNDVIERLADLIAEESSLQTLQMQEYSPSHRQFVPEVYRRAVDMLAAAREQEYGLCIIISG